MPNQTFKTLNLSEADTQVCGLSTESGAVKKLFIALQGEKTMARNILPMFYRINPARF